MTIKYMFTAGKIVHTSSLVGGSKRSCYVDSEFRYMLFTVYYSILFILGFMVNTYILYVFIHVFATKKFNEIKLFIVNMTIADLLFLVTLPMWIVYYYQRGNWILPRFLCNVAGYLFFVNTYCSVAFLGVIAYNRFQAFTRPNTTIRFSTRKRGIYITVTIWVLIAVPAMYYLIGGGPIREKVKGQVFLRCFERYDPQSDNTPILAIHVVISIGFFITFFVVLVCNTFIILQLLSQTPRDENSALMRRREIFVLCAILAVFIICFLPHHIVDLPWTLVDLNMNQMSCQSQKLLSDIHQVTLCLLGANCALNSIICSFFITQFRNYILQKIKFISDSRKGSSQATTETGQEEMVPLELEVSPSKS